MYVWESPPVCADLPENVVDRYGGHSISWEQRQRTYRVQIRLGVPPSKGPSGRFCMRRPAMWCTSSVWKHAEDVMAFDIT